MKRPLNNSDSLIPLCPSGEDENMLGRDFQHKMDELDDEDCGDEELCSSGGTQLGGGGEKKRRLSVEQVRALEKNFEVENKLEPERKVQLAQELGLQPRQVAVWFQNRRARWKTKQLERDYAALKASYDALRLDYDSLQRDKDSMLSEIKVLKAKLAEEESLMSFSSVKEEPAVSEAEDDKVVISEELPALIYKDGSSTDSDSSAVLNEAAVLNEESRPLRRRVPTTIASEILSAAINVGLGSSSSSFPPNSSTSPVQNGNSSDSRIVRGGFFYQLQHHQLLKTEENEFLSGEEPCSSFFSDEQAPGEEPCSSFFSDEQAPTLNWYCSDHCWS